jgi:hypothetical protein
MGIAEVGAIATAVAVVVQWQRARIMKAQLDLQGNQLDLQKKQLDLQTSQIAALERSRSLEQMNLGVNRMIDSGHVEHVLSMKGLDYGDWTKEDRQAAHMVALGFHMIGVSVLEKLISEDTFAKAWYYSVPTCHQILQPYLAELRRTRDSRYFSAFDVLAKRVRRGTEAFEGFEDRETTLV